MSYTQFVATASLTVPKGFNLQSYLDAISERCVKEDNFIVEHYGEYEGRVDINFNDYVRESGEQILIECNSEESNGDSGVWDWLITQFAPIMKSDYIQIKSASIDSCSGVDTEFSLYSKTGKVVNLDEIIKTYQSI
jgi:hypothetical protein